MVWCGNSVSYTHLDTFDQLMECLEKKDFEIEKIVQFAKDNFGGYRGDASDRVIDEILLQEE